MWNFGTEVTDRTTGYSGKITAYTVYDIGMVLYLVECIDTTGRPIEEWINAERLTEK